MDGERGMSNSIDRRAADPWRADITQRMQAMEQAHTETQQLVVGVKANTDEIVEFFGAAKGAFTVLGWLGKVAKWVTAISAAAAVVWALVKTGTIATK